MSDISPLLVPPPTTMGLRFGQATVLEWDNNTFENTVEFRGVTLENVPVLSSVVALTLQPGDIVGLLGWSPTGGMGSWWIIGKLVLPGSQQFLALRGGDLILVEESNFFSIDEATNRLVTIQNGRVSFGQDEPFDTFARIQGTNLDLTITADANLFAIADNQLWLEAGPGDMFLFSAGAVSIGTASNRIAGTIFMRGASNLDLSTNGGDVFLVSDNEDVTVGAGGNIFVNSGNQIQLNAGANEVFVAHNTGTADDCHIQSGGLILRNVSSRRYKTNIVDYHTDPEKVLNLRPRTWQDQTDVEADPETDRWHVGFVAEELDELGLGDFVNYDEEGRPDSIPYARLVVALLEVLKLQQRQIDWLADRVAALTEAQPERVVDSTLGPFPITLDADETTLPKRMPSPQGSPRVPAPERPEQSTRGPVTLPTDDNPNLPRSPKNR